MKVYESSSKKLQERRAKCAEYIDWKDTHVLHAPFDKSIAILLQTRFGRVIGYAILHENDRKAGVFSFNKGWDIAMGRALKELEKRIDEHNDLKEARQLIQALSRDTLPHKVGR